MAKETLNFAITLSGSFWKNQPQYSILIDDIVVVDSETIKENQALQTVRFSHDVEEGTHTLNIKLLNKTASDTLVKDGIIVNDLLLNIDDIEIDDISLGQLMWDSEYLFDQPQEYQGKITDRLDHCVNLGFNGTYILKFSSPFYIWLLEKL